MQKLLFILCGSLLLSLYACRKDMDTTSARDIGPIPVVQAESSLTGIVINSVNSPIAGAVVEVAGLRLITDQDGRFFVNRRLMNRNGEMIKVSKQGYFSAFRFAYPVLNDLTTIRIELQGKERFVLFDADAGGSFVWQDKEVVSIPAGGLATASGAPYSGQAYAYVSVLQPEAATYNQMPGDLRAIDKDGYAKVLKTFGMIGVELESVFGEPLQLKAGQKARISLPLPPVTPTRAPATIPLWHFDEENGYWREEGSATLVDGRYEGEVSHFSFWNCDLPVDYVFLKGRVTDDKNTPVTGISIEINSSGFGTGHGAPTHSGIFGGLIPAKERLTISFKDPCGTVLKSMEIGPFTADHDMGVVQLKLSEVLVISGRITDCSGNPLSNGLVGVNMSQEYKEIFAIPKPDGTFSVAIPQCNLFGPLQITALDMEAPFKSADRFFDIGAGGNVSIDAGTIPVCFALDEFIQIQVNGVSMMFPNASISIGSGGSDGYLLGRGIDSTSVSMSFNQLQNKEAVATDLYASIYSFGSLLWYGCAYDKICGICPCGPKDTEKIKFSEFSAQPGGYVVGSVSGKVFDTQTQKLAPYSMQFRVKRP